MALEHRHTHTHSHTYSALYRHPQRDKWSSNRPEILREIACWARFEWFLMWENDASMLPSLVTCRTPTTRNYPQLASAGCVELPINNGNNCRSWKSDCYANRPVVLMRKTQWAFKGLTKAMNESTASSSLFNGSGYGKKKQTKGSA